MRLLILLLSLLCVGPAFAQQQQPLSYKTTNATLLNSAAALNAAGVTASGTYSVIGIQVSGTFVATVAFQTSMDPTTGTTAWNNAICTNSSGTAVNSTTGTGVFYCLLNGSAQFQAKVTAYTSGSVTAKAVLGASPISVSTLLNSGGAGGGGTGASVSDHFITTQTDGDVANSTSLGNLGTGYIKCVVVAAVCTPSSDNTVVSTGSANTYAAGMKQTFTPNATNAGVNVGSTTAAPSVPVNGDMYYDSVLLKFQCRENGVWVNCIGSGGGGGVTIGGAASGSTHNKILYTDNTGLVQELLLNNGQVPTASGGLIVAGTVNAAPTTSKYILQQADAALPNAQALGALASGCLSVTTTTGVVASSGSACGGGSSSLAPDATKVFISEEFCGGLSSTGGIGQIGWTFRDIAGSGSEPRASGTANNPCSWSPTSGSASGNATGIFMQDTGENGFSQLGDMTGTLPWEANFVFKTSSVTATAQWIGLMKHGVTPLIAVDDFIGVRWDTSLDTTNWFFVCRKAGTETGNHTDTTIAADTGYHRLRVYSSVANQINFELYGPTGTLQKQSLNACTTTANIPTVDLTLGFQSGTREAVAKILTADYASFSRTVAR